MKNDILNEDNRTGFHTGTVVTGADRPVTGGNDAPLDVNFDQLKASAKQAKDIVMGKGTKVSSGGSGDTYIYNDNRIFNDVDNAADGGSVASDGLAWFGTHWKEAAIVAGAAAIIVALAKLVKGMNKSLKVRYNKVVKTLQRAQKDFTLKHDGLNMKSVLPGVGSGIFDWISRMWTANWKSKKNIRGNIGLHPFCAQYVVEIADDYRTATDAFSKIKLGSEGSSVDNGRNTDTTVDQETNKAVDNISTSAYSGKTYNSFYEAYREDFLNEGVTEDKVNESVIAMISGGIALASLAARAGSFIYQRFKNGKPVGEPKKIQVTKESTREICYAIINNYADKYINMQQVWKELGINTESLADVSTSDCDKLQTILKKYSKPEKNAYTKQYDRIYKAYKTMLRHYYAIGDGIISNFVKYSEAKDEKHANLVVASKEKLQNMWDSQKDFYDNNFSHVIIEITSSEPYIKYLDFIIEKVIPVFKSGLASDADYVLDIVPRKGEYYLLRQTGNGQANVGNNEDVLGNVAIAEITNFNRDSKEISFNLIGKLKDESDYLISQDGTANVHKEDIDYNAYKEQKENSLSYGKWMSLDPIPMPSTWSPDTFTLVYTREKGDEDQYIYAMGPYDEVDGKFNKIVFVKTIKGSMEVKSAQIFELDNHLSSQDIDKFFTRTDDPFNMGFKPDSDSPINEYLSYYKYWKPETEEMKTTEDIAKIINKKDEKINDIKAESKLYSREHKTDRGNEITEYIFAVIEDENESVKESENISEDENTNNVIDPNSEDADKDIVKYIFYANIAKDKNILDDDNKFDGALIKLDEPKSIKDLDNMFTSNEMGFSVVDQDPGKIKNVIKLKIYDQRGYVRVSSVGPVGIDELNDAIKEIENRETASEKMTLDSDKIADKIISEVEKLNLHNINDLNNLYTKFYSVPTVEWGDNFKKCYLLRDKNKYIDIPTGINNDNNNKEIYIKVYPSIVTTNGQKINKENRLDANVVKFGLILQDSNNSKITTAAVFDKDSIKKAIDQINKALVDNGSIENPTFVPLAYDDVDYFTDVVTNAVNVMLSDPMVSYDVNNKTFTIDKERDASNKVYIDKKISTPQERNLTIYNTLPIPNGKGNLVVKITSQDSKIAAHLQGNENNKVSVNLGGFDKDNLIKSLVEIYNMMKNGNQNTNVSASAMTVTYSHDSQVSESSQNGSITNITRMFSDKKRNWYVLSEAVYDDGSNKVSKIDDPKFVSLITEKAHCTGFAKTSRLAKFMKFESKQTYQLNSDKGYTPSVATPLYESVLLVKLDKMDNVTDKVYLGKFKING